MIETLQAPVLSGPEDEIVREDFVSAQATSSEVSAALANDTTQAGEAEAFHEGTVPEANQISAKELSTEELEYELRLQMPNKLLPGEEGFTWAGFSIRESVTAAYGLQRLRRARNLEQLSGLNN